MWLLITADIVSGAICVLTWKADSYYEQTFLCKMCYQVTCTLVIIMHFVFAMEYYSAALRLPVIVKIFSPEAEFLWQDAKCKIWTMNIIFYVSVVIWLSLFQMPFS